MKPVQYQLRTGTKMLFLYLLACTLPLISEVKCGCRETFAIVCDTFDHFKNYTGGSTMSELWIGSVDGSTNMTSVDIMKTLHFASYHNILSITVMKAVNKLVVTQYAFQCTYYNSPLQNWIFYGNIMKKIEPYHFPLIKLKKMSLVNNQIEEVKPWAFLNLEPEIFDISENLIEVVEQNSLPLVDSLKTLVLKKNKITHIEPGSFSASLENLDLSHNKLRHIQDEIFQNLVNLKDLTLSHNRFNVFPKIDQMQKLVVFDISHNAIATLKKGMFSEMDNLKYVDLSNNEIRSGSALEWISTLGKQPELYISLALNRIRNLEFENVDLQKQKLVLYGNPWDCNEWDDLKKKIAGHESDCDIEFLSKGDVPYCINFRAGGYLFVSQWDADVDRLHEVVRENEKKATCSLVPNKYRWLNPMGFGCVA